MQWPAARLAAEAGLESEAIDLFEAGEAELGEDELHRLTAAIRAAGVIPVKAKRAGEGVRFRFPPAASGTRDPRTPFATGDAALPGWLPIAEDGANAPLHPDRPA